MPARSVYDPEKEVDQHSYNQDVATTLNGLLCLLVDKGIMTREEIDRYKMREVANLDQFLTSKGKAI